MGQLNWLQGSVCLSAGTLSRWCTMRFLWRHSWELDINDWWASFQHCTTRLSIKRHRSRSSTWSDVHFWCHASSKHGWFNVDVPFGGCFPSQLLLCIRSKRLVSESCPQRPCKGLRRHRNLQKQFSCIHAGHVPFHNCFTILVQILLEQINGSTGTRNKRPQSSQSCQTSWPWEAYRTMIIIIS